MANGVRATWYAAVFGDVGDPIDLEDAITHEKHQEAMTEAVRLSEASGKTTRTITITESCRVRAKKRLKP